MVMMAPQSIEDLNFQRFCESVRNKLVAGVVDESQLGEIRATLEFWRSSWATRSPAAEVDATTVSRTNEQRQAQLENMITAVRKHEENLNRYNASVSLDTFPAVHDCDKLLDNSTEELAVSTDGREGVRKRTNRHRNSSDSTIKESNKIAEGNSSASTSTVSADRIQTLLQQQKDTVQIAVESELRDQLALESELAELTGVLKDVTVNINRAVLEQNITLDSIQDAVIDNADEVASQKEKMTVREKKSTASLFTTVGTIVMVLVIFAATYAIIRLIPKP